MKICLVAAFPPSRRQLNEYSYHLARELQRFPDVELTILADELTPYEFASGPNDGTTNFHSRAELSQFNVIRCWKFGAVTTPMRILNQVRRLKPDIVWFNLAFSTFGTPKRPIPAFAGLSIPALTRTAGFFTHITLHHIMEHCDFSSAGVKLEKIYRMGADIATQALLKADSVSVLLSDYRRTLIQKYSADNVLIGTHGTFATDPQPPDFTKRGNPDQRILAFGNWGTYKRLEVLMAAFPSVHRRVPNARLIVAGGNHPTAPGYWESVRDSQPTGLPIDFLGYVPQERVPEIFQTSSVLVMPYASSTGSSGPAHQACEFGLPIVCADIEDFRCMAEDDEMAISFYEKGNVVDLEDKLVTILNSPHLQREMAAHNYEAGVRMSMVNVVQDYLRWFDLQLCKQRLAANAAVGNGGSRFSQIRSSSTAPSLPGRVLTFSPQDEGVRHPDHTDQGKRIPGPQLNDTEELGPTQRSLGRSQAQSNQIDDDGCVDVG